MFVRAMSGGVVATYHNTLRLNLSWRIAWISPSMAARPSEQS